MKRLSRLAALAAISFLFIVPAEAGWFFHWRHPTPTPAPSPPPDPTPSPAPAPNPTPTPVEGFTLSAIGLGSAFGVDDALSEAARDHEIGAFLTSQNGTWTIIADEVMAANHPQVFDTWADVAAKSGKQKPLAIWHDQGKVLAIDELAGKSKAEILALARSHVPSSADAVTIRGQKRLLGLKLPPAGLKSGLPGLEQILQPLAAADCPSVNLASQFLYQKNQTGGTCVLNATCAACEAAVYVEYGKANCTEFSPYFLANLTNGYNGTYAEAAVQDVLKYGNLPFSTVAPYQKNPAGWQQTAAAYKGLAVYGPPPSDSPGYLRAALHRGYVALCGIAVGNGFDPDANGYISYARGGGPSVNHEIVVCGWDQTSGAYLIKNSWGADWGTNGYAWLDPQFFQADTDLWTIVGMTAAPSYQFYAPADQPARMRQPAKPLPRAVDCPKCPGGVCPLSNAN